MPEQSIYGFLGPNGAGKTTTMRLLLGLLKKQAGVIRILGEQPDRNRVALLRKIGSLIEAPSLYAHLSATENLRVLNKIYRSTEAALQRALEITGLEKAGTKPAGKFSLGMKQRLGIAASLLHAPSLLILDEPTNGLDPNGIIEIRDLFLSLNRQEGVSIFISSHLLSEIELVSNYVGIIHKGCMLFQGPMRQLHKKAQTRIIFTTSDIPETIRLLRRYDPSSEIEDKKVIAQNLTDQDIAAVNKLLVQHNIDVYQISTEKESLEKIFMSIINNIS